MSDLPGELRLLVVEHDEIAREHVFRALERVDVTIECAESVESALVALARASYDCVLLGCFLPDGSGMEVLEKQVGQQVGQQVGVPFIVLTGQGDERTAAEAMKAGATDYLVKEEMSARQLHRAITRAVRVRRAEQQTWQAQQQLESERALLREVIKQMPAGVVIAKAPGGEVILCNEQLERVLGSAYTAAECRPYTGFSSAGETYAAEDWPLERALASGEVVESELIDCEREDGSRVTLDCRAGPVSDDRDEIVAAVMTLNDVTRLKAGEEAMREEARLVRLVNSIGSSLSAEHDTSKLLDGLTEHAIKLTGATHGVSFTEADKGGVLFGWSSRPERAPEPAAALPSRATLVRLAELGRVDDVSSVESLGLDAQFFVPAAARPARAFLAMPVRRRDGTVAGGILLSHRAPGHFAERAERLLGGIVSWAALALENAALLQAAQRAVDNRDHVLSIVSHDLRGPLNNVSLAADLLNNQAGEVAANATAVIKRSVRAADRLIGDLLDVASIEAGGLSIDRQRTSVGELFEQIREAHRAVATERGIRLQLDLLEPSPSAELDQQRMQQVLSNLIDNALRYTPRDGRITLGARETPTGLRIWVEDTGGGIDADVLPHLFDRYWQARDQARGSAGLGLAIARGIIHAHGGEIEVTSRLDAGTRFTIELP